MARTSTYLNFTHHTEEAFNFYKTVFGTEFTAPGIGVWAIYLPKMVLLL
jgi:PhnB protein